MKPSTDDEGNGFSPASFEGMVYRPVNLSPLIQSLTPDLSPLIQSLTPDLSPLIQSLTPDLSPLIQSLTPDLSPLIQSLTPDLSPLIQSLNITPIFTNLVQSLDLTPLFSCAFRGVDVRSTYIELFKGVDTNATYAETVAAISKTYPGAKDYFLEVEEASQPEPMSGVDGRPSITSETPNVELSRRLYDLLRRYNQDLILLLAFLAIIVAIVAWLFPRSGSSEPPKIEPIIRVIIHNCVKNSTPRQK